MGVKYGLLTAQLALALNGRDRTEVLARLLELLAQRDQGRKRRTRLTMSELIRIITAEAPAIRNRSLDAFCRSASLAQLLEECASLDRFRRDSENLYERVRALFFLYAIYRFHIPLKPDLPSGGLVPFDGYDNLLKRRFAEAIDIFLAAPLSDGTASALAEAYRRLGFQTLANQVRRSVRSVRGNQWMFRIGHPADHPLRVRPELYQAVSRTGSHNGESGAFPGPA